MANNFVKIFDDTIIKLSVNQGLEDQRTCETLGTFTVGELAYTRDTGRLFVGDNSDGEIGHRGLQETVGGTLVGNKYLGLIDSKPLVTFFDNGKPLSYENSTLGSDNGVEETGLLLENSKFRLHSDTNSDEKWDNWDRKSTYNAKYNAYNGDFMYDVYQNAFILFDTRISGKENANFQPIIKVDENGVPVEPETFIVNGEEIPSNSPEAIKLTRRSKLINHTSSDGISEDVIYGDGYVIIRNVEPDNATIRFKSRSFHPNGLPEDGVNYTHNLLEVFNIPTKLIKDRFSDDFIKGDTISLNKNLANIQSITGNNGTIKLPNDISFSVPVNDSRDGRVIMNWRFTKPNNVLLNSDDSYYLTLKPSKRVVNGGEEYISFQAQLAQREKVRPPFYIKLDTGLNTSQNGQNILTLDTNAMNLATAPTLSVNLDSFSSRSNVSIDPYRVLTDYKKNINEGVIGNITVTSLGTVKSFDTFPSGYYGLAYEKIDKWEEENPTINFLKEPVIIAQSSTDASLFQEIPDSTTKQKLNAEQTFQLSPIGANILMDFTVDPNDRMLYCEQKIVSTPHTTVLPKVDKPSQYPLYNKSYFASFSETNVKVWNNLFVVLGRNHYANLTVDPDYTKTPIVGIKKEIPSTKCAYISGIDFPFEGNNIKVFKELSGESDLKYCLFAWYKEYEKIVEYSEAYDDDVERCINLSFYPVPAFDVSTKYADSSKRGEMSSVKIEGNDNELLYGAEGVVFGPEEVVSDNPNRFRRLCGIPITSSLWTKNERYIHYVCDLKPYTFDITENNLHFEYTQEIKIFDNPSVVSLNFYDKDGHYVTKHDVLDINSDVTRISERVYILGNDLEVDDNSTIKEYGYVVVSSVNDSDVKYATYKVAQDVPYNIIYAPPSTLENVSIWDGEKLLSNVTLDETISPEDQVFIPEHARSVLLEIDYTTSANNQIAVFYAKKFDELGITFSGFGVQEFKNPQEDYTKWTSNVSNMFSGITFVEKDGIYKQKLGKVKSKIDKTYQFHSLNDTSTINKSRIPSVFVPNEHEKVIFKTCQTESRIVEVPLHNIDKGVNEKHFALRVANVKPTTSKELNELVIRVVGYRL